MQTRIKDTYILGCKRKDLECIRCKLQEEDAYFRQWTLYKIPGKNWLTDATIDGYHEHVFAECGVSTWRYLGVSPFGNE